MSELGNTYKRKDGKKATVVEENEKFKTCIMQFEDGKTISLTTTTLHNTWERVEK